MKKVPILAADKRDGVGTRVSRRLRRTGRVPAIVYGHKQEALPVAIDQDALEAAVRHHARMVDLKIGSLKERVLLAEVQHDTFGTEIIHADFIRVAMDELVRIEVPVVLHGRAIGEQHGGVTEQLMTAVEVECLPGDIPEEVTVVITELEVGQSRHVADLTAPDKVKIVSDPSMLVLTIATPTKAEEPVAAEVAAEAEAGAEEPEVITKGKGEVDETAEADSGEAN